VSRWLVVRSAGRQIAVPAETVDAVIELPVPLPAPGLLRAVRGVVPLRGVLTPVAHLAAAIADTAPPTAVCAVGVAVLVAGRRLVLEVDDAVDLQSATAEPLPEGWRGRWAASAIRGGEGLVPTLDVDWLAARIRGAGERTTA